MQRFKRWIFKWAVAWFAVWLMPLLTLSQDFAHYRLGGNEILSQHIYTILYSAAQQLYIGTNEGAYVYGNGKFRAIPLENGNVSGAIFGLRENKKGEVFCFNLAGEIFQVNEPHLRHLTTIPKEHMGTASQMEIDDQDHLVFLSKSALKWANGALEIIHQNPNRISALSKHPIEESLFFNFTNGEPLQHYFIWKNGQLEEHTYNGKGYPDLISGFLFFEQDTLAHHMEGHFTRLRDAEPVFIPNKVPRERTAQFNLKSVWNSHPKLGIRKLTMEAGQLKASNLYLPVNFISTLFQSPNGTLFLGTFGQGVFVVPDTRTDAFRTTNTPGFVNRIAVDNQDVLYALTRNGILYRYQDGQVEELPYNSAYDPNFLFVAESFDFKRNPKVPELLHPGPPAGENRLPFSGLKKIKKVNDSCLITYNPFQIIRYGNGLEDFEWVKFEGQELWSFLKLPISRFWAIDYDNVRNFLFMSDQFGLKVLAPKMTPEAVLYQGKPVLCKSLAFHNGQMWCGTLNQGILIFEGKKFVRQISSRNGLGNQNIKKIAIKHGFLFVSHRSGFQIQDMKSGIWRTLGAAEGVPNGSVQDFSVGKNKLWMLSGNTPISVDLDALPHKDPDLLIHIDSVLIGGKSIDWQTMHQFGYDDNRFAMFLEVRGIDFLREARLFYRLVGVDTSWFELEVEEDILEFKSLAPGNFQVELKCEYRGEVVDEFTYQFKIQPPIWQRWWFYLLMIIVVLSLTSIVFFAQIKRLRKRNAERLERQRITTDLLESELKALRSQMNPHFIFNSLNAIQELLLNEDTDASYDYIVLFATLVRKALNHSKREFIPIDEELGFLEAYLSLEKLRFREDFSYRIDYQGPKGIEIPTLLVQPFIENAMLHGLLHKKGQKKLGIQFSLQEEQLTCTIVDNGVGRKRARAIQKRRKSEHQSFALESIQKRLDILNQRYEVDTCRFTIEDLEENGQATGTRISVNIPFSRIY